MKLNLKLVSPVLMWAIIIAGITASILMVDNRMLFDTQPFGWIALGAVLMNAAYVYALSFRVHAKAPQSAANIDSLITEGIYAVVRHPIYMADILIAVGMVLAFPRADVLTGAIWAGSVFWFWMFLEERALEEKFLEDYRSYRSRVPMVFPSLRK